MGRDQLSRPKASTERKPSPFTAIRAGSSISSRWILGLLDLQCLAGNSAVTDLIARARTDGYQRVQRQEQEPKGRVIDVEDIGHPPSEEIQLPTVDPRVTIVDDDLGECRMVLLSEIRDSLQYIDNDIERVTAMPVNWMTVEVKEMELTYGSGRRLTFLMASINHDAARRADVYQKRNGVIWPLGADGSVTLDAENTRNVVAMAEWVYQERAHRLAKRLEIAELTATFAGAIASLGGVASMGSGASGPRPSLRGLPTGGGSKGQGGGSGGKPPGKPPAGFKSNKEMARIMRWGQTKGGKAPDLRQRIAGLTKEELVKEGLTLDEAKWWRDTYKWHAENNPGNPAAPGRYALMERAVELLSGGK